jgi:hypothetical protein
MILNTHKLIKSVTKSACQLHLFLFQYRAYLLVVYLCQQMLIYIAAAVFVLLLCVLLPLTLMQIYLGVN